MADLTKAQIGNDVSTTADGDLDLTFEPITGSKVVAEGVLRRWFTRRKRCFWATDMGRNAQSLINADMTPLQIERVKMALSQEALAVDGCKRCTVTIERDEESGAMSIKADVTGQAGRADVNVTIGNAGQIIAAQIRARNGS